MPKFEFELKGLKVKYDGELTPGTSVADEIGKHVSALIAPVLPKLESEASSKPAAIDVTPKRTKRASPVRRMPSDAIDWEHSTEKWGSPRQDWTTAEKCMWLLLIVDEAVQKRKVRGAQLVATFNKHFYQAGKISSGHVSRDLGKLKLSKDGEPASVGQDSGADGGWFLTECGRKKAGALVDQARGKSAA